MMKSRKSCFDPAISHMTFRRFYPMCILHTIVLALLAIAFVNFGGKTTLDTVQGVRGFCEILPLFNLVYALVLAQLLFGDLYQTRLCYGLSALPITRGGWLGTQVIWGILSVIPGIIVSGGMMLFSLIRFRMVILHYMAANFLQFLFYFGVATLCAVCAGNRIGMALLYLIVNFGGFFFDWTRIKILCPLIFGMYLPNSNALSSPVSRMLYYDIFKLTYQSNKTVTQSPDGPTVIFSTHEDELITSLTYGNYLLIMLLFAVAGCVAIYLANRFLRRRRAECTGELLAFRVAEPVLVILCAVFTGILLNILFVDTDWNAGLVLLFVGIVLGYYAALMLIRRRVNVFTAKTLPPLAWMLGLCLLLLTATGLNWFGFADKIPEAEQVESVTIDMRYNGSTITSSDPEDISLALSVQREALDDHALSDCSRTLLERIFGNEEVHLQKLMENGEREAQSAIFLIFNMRDGSQIGRSYPIYASSSCIDPLRQRFSEPEVVFDWVLAGEEPVTKERLMESLQYITYEWWEPDDSGDGATLYNARRVPDSDYSALLDAILADCENGSAADAYIFHGGNTYNGYFELCFRNGSGNNWFTFYLYPDCTSVLAFVEEYGYNLPAGSR